MKKSLKQQRHDVAKKKHQQRIIMFAVGAVGVLFLLIAVGASLYTQAPPVVDANDAQQVALGKQVYDVQCAGCHGPEMEGQENWQEGGENGLLLAPPHDETGHTWHHNNSYLIASVSEGGARLPANTGVSPMPAYGNILSKTEIAASIAYIQSTWPPEIRIQQSQR